MCVFLLFIYYTLFSLNCKTLYCKKYIKSVYFIAYLTLVYILKTHIAYNITTYKNILLKYAKQQLLSATWIYATKQPQPKYY